MRNNARRVFTSVSADRIYAFIIPFYSRKNTNISTNKNNLLHKFS